MLLDKLLADANGVDSGAVYMILGGTEGTNSLSTADVFLIILGAAAGLG